MTALNLWKLERPYFSSDFHFLTHIHKQELYVSPSSCFASHFNSFYRRSGIAKMRALCRSHIVAVTELGNLRIVELKESQVSFKAPMEFDSWESCCSEVSQPCPTELVSSSFWWRWQPGLPECPLTVPSTTDRPSLLSQNAGTQKCFKFQATLDCGMFVSTAWYIWGWESNLNGQFTCFSYISHSHSLNIISNTILVICPVGGLSREVKCKIFPLLVSSCPPKVSSFGF